MKRAIFVGAASILAALTAACVEPPVKPIPDSIRGSVAAVSADLSGVKDSDTSKLGARGSDEGGKLGALQGAATVARNTNSLIGMLVLMPVGAAVGGAKGAAEAQSPEIVDQTRANLRLAIQETDFAEMLRQRLATSKAGLVDFSTVSAGASSAPLITAAGAPVGHVIALEFRLHIYNEYFVNPLVGVFVRVTAQVQSPDRKQVVHTATWSYCSQRADFVQMAANNAAAFRAEISRAAAVLGEAIPYDLYVSRQPRALRAQELGNLKMYAGCMDFSDLPSRTGQTPVILPPMPEMPPKGQAPSAAAAPPPFSGPTVAAAAAPAPAQVASAAPVVPAAAAIDGNWLIEMQISSTFCLAQNAPVTFANRVAEGPWGKLQVSADGELGGWMKLKPLNTSSTDYLVNLSGRLENGSIAGTISGRCPGTFVMKKQ